MSNVKVEKQEPQGPSSPGAFEEWYDTKFKHGFERGPNDKYVARKAWFAALYTAPQPCPECEERKTTALNYISLTFEFEQLQSKYKKLKAIVAALEHKAATEVHLRGEKVFEKLDGEWYFTG